MERGLYTSKATSCKYEGIDYIGAFRGMTQDEVEAIVAPLPAVAQGNIE